MGAVFPLKRGQCLLDVAPSPFLTVGVGSGDRVLKVLAVVDNTMVVTKSTEKKINYFFLFYLGLD